jgi:hypothetical protein
MQVMHALTGCQKRRINNLHLSFHPLDIMRTLSLSHRQALYAFVVDARR